VVVDAHLEAEDIPAATEDMAAKPSFLRERESIKFLPIGPVPFSVGRAVFYAGPTSFLITNIM
jgi:hypothetical protein